MKLFTFLMSFFLLGHSAFAREFQARPECFRFLMSRMEAPIESQFYEMWCYQKKSDAIHQYLFIFNLDESGLKPEMSALVTLDKNGKPKFLSSGSLTKGELSFDQLPDLALNPYSIPLTLSQARKHPRVFGVATKVSDSELNELFESHLFQSKDRVNLAPISEGVFSSSVEDSKKPFNGFWWSAAGLPLAAGPHSPLGIYDQYLKARNGGLDPGSVRWESKNHFDTGISWGGHCNGWAASSVLFKEPTLDLYDPLTNEIITPYAQKGMLAEASYCINASYFGKRFHGYANEDILDIYPDLFHKTLQYYIREGGKVIATDYVRGTPIDNNLISAYRFVIKKTGVRQFHVNAFLTIHSYDPKQEDSIGTALSYERPYSYTLTTDAEGAITGGDWDQASDNPDFFWIPLGISGMCGAQNPNVDPLKVQGLIESLPKAVQKNLSIHFNLTQKIEPQVQVPVSLGSTNLIGDHFKLNYTVRKLQPSSQTPALYIWLAGNARYPILNGTEESVVVPLEPGTHVLDVDRLMSINKFVIVNRDLTIATDIDLTIDSLDYLGSP